MSSDEIKAILNDPEKLAEVCKAAFQSVDTDGSGHIDKTELTNCMSSMAKDLGIPSPSDDEISSAFKELDTSKDGKISLDEFSVLTKQLLTLMSG